ncbi:MAG: type II toxin-antitoxin system VapC family toxin [Gammaproteobacteria bacterium]|nr:type II toxin-antitoxin system VapC family toxin [Gammaproteobacteria bacterium]MDE0283422.1 type II toxin-antitoxin system VapC family toxin [Gammaproteobacteria bacterium]
MKIYADTSVFGGVFDQEFSEPSKQFFDEIDAGRFILVTSAVVAAEIEPAPDKIRSFFAGYTEAATIVDVSGEALELRLNYIKSGVVTEASLDDALHVAVATVSGCDLIVSWNFRHIVHFQKIPKYNAVNRLNGHNHIGIYSPLEVIQYDNS